MIISNIERYCPGKHGVNSLLGLMPRYMLTSLTNFYMFSDKKRSPLALSREMVLAPTEKTNVIRALKRLIRE